MDTSELHIPQPTFTALFSACTHQLVTDFMDVIACQRWCQLPLHLTLINRNWPKLTTGITKSWCRLVEMSSRQSVYKWSKFQDCVHEDHRHIASYCCFIQTAPTLYGTYIKKWNSWNVLLANSGWRFAFQINIAESATPTLWDLCLDPKIYCLHQGTKSAPNHGCHANDWDVHPWKFKAANFAASILARFGNEGGINSGEPVLGT